jgi:hypothetical protein
MGIPDDFTRIRLEPGNAIFLPNKILLDLFVLYN